MSPSTTGDLQYRFRHTMLPVGDMGRTVDFYTRLLGMKVVRNRGELDDPDAVYYLAYGDEGTHPALELIAGTGHADKPSYGHVAIAVSDLKALCARLEEEGVPFKRPFESPTGGSNRHLAVALDPDGHQVELNERRDGIYS